jgi:hypothetical protein
MNGFISVPGSKDQRGKPTFPTLETSLPEVFIRSLTGFQAEK